MGEYRSNWEAVFQLAQEAGNAKAIFEIAKAVLAEMDKDEKK